MDFADTPLRIGNVDLTYGQLDDAAHALVHRPGVDKHTLGVALGCMEVLARLREAQAGEPRVRGESVDSQDWTHPHPGGR